MSFQNKPVSEFMGTDILVLKPSETVSDARDSLSTKGVSGAPVIDENGHLIGVFSKSDLMWNESFEGALKTIESFSADSGDKSVAEVMSDRLVVCEKEALAAEAAQLMLKHRVHRVIVVENHKPVGVVSSFDILQLIDV